MTGTRLSQQADFDDLQIAQSTKQGNVPELQATHEEADTRIILHACHAISSGYKRVVVESRDTDVILMMIYHLGYLAADVWMASGTSKQRKCYPIGRIAETLPRPVVNSILGFHALTGCDTTSSFTGHGKKTCWKVYLKHPDLLSGLGQNENLDNAEEFVCRLYDAASSLKCVNLIRHAIFQKGQKTLEMLPPTKNALYLHIARADYQAKLWRDANVSHVDIGPPSNSGGWVNKANGLEVVWCTLPSVPNSCVELVTCGCKTKC